MKVTTMAEAIGGIDDDLVSGAVRYRPRRARAIKAGWRKWAAAAACLTVLVAAGAIAPKVLTHDTPPDDREIMIESRYLDICYVSESGAVESSGILVRCTPEDIFAEWTRLNGITDVSLIECRIDSGDASTVKGDPNDPKAPVEHHVGDSRTLVLTVSSGFSRYADSENGKMLTEALEKTFYAYSAFDTFKLVIQ